MTTKMLMMSLAAAMPELQLALSLLLLLLVGVLLPNPARAVRVVGLTTIITLLGVASIYAFNLAPYTGEGADYGRALDMPFNSLFVVDSLSQMAKLLACLSAAACALLALPWLSRQAEQPFEYFILLLLAVTGLCLMASSNNFLTLYLGLELQSLALYVLAAFSRHQLASSEAGLKYFVLGALSSGMLLFGVSLLYGATGQVSFDALGTAGLFDANIGGSTLHSLPLVFGLLFVLAGLAFKISAVPFHAWAPDVYQGAPTPVAAFIAAVPKVVVFVVLLRLAQGLGENAARLQWPMLLAILAAASMVLGAFAAIRQVNLKRLLAYSSIGHMGYALMGLAASTPQGASATFYYLAVYSLMTVGAFAFLVLMEKNGAPLENLSQLRGLAKTQPLAAYAFSFIVLSLAGLPIFAGFFAKLSIFHAVIGAGLLKLTVLAALASVVSAYYYLRLCKIMFFDAPEGAAAVFLPSLAARSVFFFSSALCLLFFLKPAAGLMEMIRVLVQQFFLPLP
jgi:NADH-quinone oxidoreductase subunit N